MLGSPPESESELQFNGNTWSEIRISEDDLQTLMEEGELQIKLVDGNRNTHPVLTLVGSDGKNTRDDDV